MYLVKSRIIPEYARKLTSLEDIKRLESGQSAIAFWAAHLRNMVVGAPRLLSFSADFARRRTFATRKLPSVVLHDPRDLYPLDVNAEQEPNPESRVTLGKELDPHGVARLNIAWRTTEADHRRLVEGLKVMRSAFSQSSTADLHFSDEDFEVAVSRKVPVGGHHIGTARMADTANEGVCDSNGELFGTKGVYIAGAAAFSTSSFANPTLTLIALSLRLAQHIAAANRCAKRPHS
jgi:choline dehydrogenase-like flavoprotein